MKIIVTIIAVLATGQTYGPILPCWDADPPPVYDICIEDKERCLCNGDVWPPWLRFRIYVPPVQWSIEQYRTLQWIHFGQYHFRGPDTLVYCRSLSLFDYDGDNDVDLRDFARYQNEWCPSPCGLRSVLVLAYVI